MNNKAIVLISITIALSLALVVANLFQKLNNGSSEYNSEIGFIALLILLFVEWFILRKKEFKFGYKHFGIYHQRGIKKEYKNVEVKFFNWGSSDPSADGNDSYFGIYGLMKCPFEIKTELIKPMFDTVEMDFVNNQYIYLLKKRNVFMGEPEMKILLEKFDHILLEATKNS